MTAVKAIRIKARRAGFRRAGLAHPAEWVTHPLASFTEAQLKALRAEPQLIVEDLDDAPAPVPAGGSADPASPADSNAPRGEPKADAGAEETTAASAPATPAVARPKGKSRGK